MVFFRLWCTGRPIPQRGSNLLMLALAQHGVLLSPHCSAWILTTFGWMTKIPLPLLILFVSVGLYVYYSFAFFPVCVFFAHFTNGIFGFLLICIGLCIFRILFEVHFPLFYGLSFCCLRGLHSLEMLQFHMITEHPHRERTSRGR